MEKMKAIDSKSVDVRRIDPDPATVLLGVISVVGSFASIAGYLEQRAEKRRYWISDDDKKRAELVEQVAAIESALSEIDGQLQKLRIILKIAYNAKDLEEMQDNRLALGVIKPVFKTDAYKMYAALHVKVSTLSTKAIRATYRAIALIDELGVDVSKDVFVELEDIQSRLNRMLVGEITFLDAYSLQLEVIGAARRTADRMREEFGIKPEPHDDNAPGVM